MKTPKNDLSFQDRQTDMQQMSSVLNCKDAFMLSRTMEFRKKKNLIFEPTQQYLVMPGLESQTEKLCDVHR